MANFKSLRDHLPAKPDNIQLLDNPIPVVITCQSCMDTGYIRFDVPVGHPYFGRMMECDAPGCPVVESHRRARVEKIMQQSTWDADYNGVTFDSFGALADQYENGWEGKRGAFAVAQCFAIWDGAPFTLDESARHVWSKPWPKADARPSHSGVLTGDVGLGKTGLLVSATNLLIARNKPVVFIRVRDLIARIQETYKANWDGEPADQRLKFYSSVQYLCIDEFALENYTEDRLEIVETVIRGRDRAALPTLISTNLSLKDMYANWQPRIADIVAKYHWVTVAGVKLRQTREKPETW